ncbi:MAG TPA: hypothetical protein VFZ45_05100 [Actinomycetota bacterium]|nr:hypothetical protein [Actinomycetota bacterium]
MRAVHLVAGAAIVGAFGIVWLWGLVTWIVRRGPGRAFWWVVGFVQGAVLIQALVGVVLLFTGGRATILHIVYGVVFPALVLGVAHVLARDAFAHRPWAPFALASFFCFGLTLRALMTGLGVG